MPNRLSLETSPYLQQHAENPVEWYPWGEEALERARKEDKPILLSVGYSACHWCHVMEHESFENPAIAQLLNRDFVSIKVDREERPDVDRVYMAFVQSTTGAGGWPMTVFLTPELKPFYGGTYWPPENKFGRPSFLQVLQQVNKAWQERRDQLLGSSEELHRRLREMAETPNMIYYLYVVEEENSWKLLGLISLRSLILADPSMALKDVMRTDFRSAHPSDSVDDVAQTISEYNLLALPVIDDEGDIAGIVTVDDAMEILLPKNLQRRLPRLFG